MSKKKVMKLLLKDLLVYCHQQSLKTKNNPEFLSPNDLGFRNETDLKKKMKCAISKLDKRGKCRICRKNCNFKCTKCGQLCQEHAVQHLLQM